MQTEQTSGIVRDSREEIIKGALLAADVVTSSMGVGKKQVAISHFNVMPFPSPDGATIASNIKVQDRVQRIGSDYSLQAAKLTAKQAGDGTTTTMQLISGILNNFNRRSSVRQLTSELTEAAEYAVECVKKMSVPITVKSELVNVATISANNDPKLGRMIADLVWKVGKHGTIYVEDSDLLVTETELKKGYVLKPGLADEKFMGRNPRGFSWASPKIMLIDDHIFDAKQLKIVYDRFMSDFSDKHGRLNDSLLIVFTKIDGSALESVIGSFLQGGKFGPMPVIAATINGRNKMDVLEDLSAISGAPIFSDSTNNPISKLRMNGNFSKQFDSPFGEVKKITFSSEEVTIFFDEEKEIIVGYEDKQPIVQTPREYVRLLEAKSYQGEREEKRLERISKLTNGVGYIKIGGTSNAGMIGTGQLIDDAQMASINALRHGYLPGGGYTLLQVAKEVDKLGTEGARLLAKAMRGCFKKMLKNSEYPLGLFGRTSGYEREGHVFNMKTGEFEPVLQTQVLDSAKAVECAIRNGTSVCCEIIKTGPALIWS